jgi:hypothetical protein
MTARFSTRIHWNGRNWIVTLSRGDTVVAEMTLDDWLELEVNRFAIEDAGRFAAWHHPWAFPCSSETPARNARPRL